MKKYVVSLVFIAILALGFVTRFYKLGAIPAGLYLDEAAQGSNAYSILKTGKDEFGKSFPIVFRSFTDFKTPVYIYTIVPLIPIFGLTKFAVRFPSFFFSMLTFPFFYLLIKRLAPSKIATQIALLSTLLLAISPWHVLFGRTNFEVNLSVFFLVSGCYYLFKSVDFGATKNLSTKALVTAAVLLAIAIPSYHSQRVVVPLILFAFFVRYRTVLLSGKLRPAFVTGLVAGVIILLPTLSVATTPGFLARAAGLNIFTSSTPAGHFENYHGLGAGLVNGRLFLSTKEFLALYTSYFSPRDIFWLGDSGPRSSFPGLGTFYVWQLPFYAYGLYLIAKDKRLKDLRFFALALLIISPVPAAVTRDPYSTIRSLTMVLPICVLVAYGMIGFYNLARERFINDKKMVDLGTMVLGIALLSFSLGKLWSSAFILNEHHRASEWNYGFEHVTHTLQSLDPNLPVVVDNARTEPYSQLLFFLKFDPARYQATNYEVPLAEYYTNMDRNKTKVMGNITTRSINWDTDVHVDQYLVGDALTISDSQMAEHGLELVRDISYPDWSLAFRIVRTNPQFELAKLKKTAN